MLDLGSLTIGRMDGRSRMGAWGRWSVLDYVLDLLLHMRQDFVARMGSLVASVS